MATNQRLSRTAPGTSRANQRAAPPGRVVRQKTDDGKRVTLKVSSPPSPPSPDRRHSLQVQHPDANAGNEDDGLMKLSSEVRAEKTPSSPSASPSSSAEKWGFLLTRRLLMEMLAKKKGTIDLSCSPYGKNKWTQRKKVEEVSGPNPRFSPLFLRRECGEPKALSRKKPVII